jgi:purine nucleosidase
MNPWKRREVAVDLAGLPTFDDIPFAAQAIVDLVMSNPGEITLVPIGPLTNIATAMLIEPRVADNAKEIVIMGGYFFGQQNNVEVPGEFNIWADPEAAHIVLQSGAQLRFVGLDVTYRVRMDQEQARGLANSSGEFGKFAGACGLAWIETLRTRYPHSKTHGSFHLHDPLAIAAVTHPDLIEWQPAHVTVALDGVARGITIADTLGTHGAPAANCLIARDVDAPGFVNHFIERVARL